MPNGNLIDPGAAWTNPEGTAEELVQAQFADWASTFQPVEIQALNDISLNNPSVLSSAIEKAQNTTMDSFNAMQGVLNRQNRALGIQPTAQQATASRRLMNLNQALGMANAANTTRGIIASQDQQLLFGGGANPNISLATS